MIRIVGHGQAQGTVMDRDLSPRTRRQPVPPAQASWHGRRRPLRAGAGEGDAGWKLVPIAQYAVQWRPDLGRAFRFVENPRAKLEGRFVADVLVVPARELSDPVAGLVTVKAGDYSLHLDQPTADSFSPKAQQAFLRGCSFDVVSEGDTFGKRQTSGLDSNRGDCCGLTSSRSAGELGCTLRPETCLGTLFNRGRPPDAHTRGLG